MEVAGLTVDGQRVVSRMNTPAVIEVRTARPTASPTPAGPPEAVKP